MENKILILRKMVAEYEITTGKKATAIYMNPETFNNSIIPAACCVYTDKVSAMYCIFGIPVIFKSEIENGVMYVGDIMEVENE